MTTTVIVGNPKPRSRTYEKAVSLADRRTGRPAERRSALYLIDRELDDSPAPTGWLDAARPRLAGLGVLT